MFYSDADKLKFRLEMYMAVALFDKATYEYEEFVFSATDWGYYEYEIKGKYLLVVKYLGYQSKPECKEAAKNVIRKFQAEALSFV